jgi:hypothetical protein
MVVLSLAFDVNLFYNSYKDLASTASLLHLRGAEPW